jgi:hypothetical protein
MGMVGVKIYFRDKKNEQPGMGRSVDFLIVFWIQMEHG